MNNMIKCNVIIEEHLIHAILTHIKKHAILKPLDEVVESFFECKSDDELFNYTKQELTDLLLSKDMSFFVLIDNKRVMLTSDGHDFFDIFKEKMEAEKKLKNFYLNLENNCSV